MSFFIQESKAGKTDITVQVSSLDENSNGDIEELSSNNDSPIEKVEKKFRFFQIDKDYKIQRHLNVRHVQLIAISGAIGTSIFVTIATGLLRAGPAGLFTATAFYTALVLMMNSAVGEMVTQYPLPSPFVSMAGRCIDEALEVSSGYNFFLMESLYIPFEATAVSAILNYWRDDFSAGIPIAAVLALYLALNIYDVALFGEAEFVLSITKLILAIGLLFFTLITMCGGNPNHDAFGFRNFGIEPFGSGYITTGSLGRFDGWLAALFQANQYVGGPEYMSSTLAEAKDVRRTSKMMFKSVIIRLCIFYVGGSLSVGILLACNDPTLIAEHGASSTDVGESPYVIAMNNLNIAVLPNIVNAVVLLSALSAGNSYVYCASRQLYALSIKGFAPSFFKLCTRQGIPIFAVLVTWSFGLLAFLSLGSGGTLGAFTYLTNICTKSQVLLYFYMIITYDAFYWACKKQGVDRTKFTYVAYFQPYSAYIVTFFLTILVGIIGYSTFIPGMWAISDFIFYYIMLFVNVGIFIFWKLFKKTKFKRPSEVDLQDGLEEVEEYEYQYHLQMEKEGKTGKPNLRQTLFQWLL
ncbi:hypothetical protein PACTADRAFT_39048 [Pachysolen tannophilus NRRL Y-2460]|uniref:Amino acid permease/ SLC12A domain-containing protein n=1 Tax=Pachysolen tannophilus NRRL Y-2460 TaxID=669874 RepID=A0A1E4TZW9_PACTA|nr:hypothetical protein PACTADRAFT_39048 [Pachysolen tannophilus NRRL Y-2460]